MMEAVNVKYVMEVPQIQAKGPTRTNTNFRLHTSENFPISKDARQPSAVFEVRFSRCHKMLRVLACRVLGSSEQAPQVVENCKITASRNPPAFEYEGAFRSWLVRILIDEALLIVRQRKGDFDQCRNKPKTERTR